MFLLLFYYQNDKGGVGVMQKVLIFRRF